MKRIGEHRLDTILDQSKLPYYLILAPLLGAVIGLFAVQEDPVLLLIGFFLSVRFIIFNNAKVLPIIIMISVFFADWLSAIGLIPYSFTWLPDLALLIFSMKVVLQQIQEPKRIRTSIDLPLFVFIFWGLISMVLNHQSPFNMFFSLRQMLKFSLMFYLLVYINFDEQFIKRLNKLLIFLIIIQVPTALIKMTVHGRTEFAIGTYANFGGGMTPVLTLFVDSVCLGLYLFHNQNFKYILFMLYFQLFYYACPKRIYPVFAMIVGAFLLLKAGSKQRKKLVPLIPVLILGLALVIYVNPDWGQIFTNPSQTMHWATSYTYQKNDEVTSGRTAVAELVIKTLLKKPLKLLFGFGPGTMTESFSQNKEQLHETLSIYYGLTDFVIISMEYGIIGTLIFLWLLLSVYRMNNTFFIKTRDPYWKALSFGYKGIIFTCLISIFYTPIFRLDLSGFLFWFGGGIIYTMGHQHGIFNNAKQ